MSQFDHGIKAFEIQQIKYHNMNGYCPVILIGGKGRKFDRQADLMVPKVKVVK